MFRCVAAIPNMGGNCIQLFYEDTEEGRTKAEAFVREHDKPGMGVYDCVALLKEERRAKDTVAEIPGLHWDIDARQVNENKEQIIKRVRDKLEAFGLLSRLIDSGRGVHVYSTLREPIAAGAPEMQAAEQLLTRMIEHLGADPALKHFAALMRRPGTTNSKEGGGPCRVVLDTGARCDLSDIAAYLELVENNGPLFTAREEPNKTNNEAEELPTDPEVRLAIMRFGSKSGRGVNATLCHVIPAMIWKAIHPEDIHRKVMAALRATALRDNLNWDWKAEERQTHERILAAYYNLFEKDYVPAAGVPVWLTMEFHQTWTEVLAEGRCPTMMRNGSSYYVRRKREFDEKNNTNQELATAGEKENEAGEAPKDEAPKDDAPKTPFILRPFEPFDAAQLPPREFLFGKHYQRRTVSGTVAPGGTGKSSLGMVESVAMATGRNLLDEEVRERARVWYHNGEDNMVELQRRLAGICQHYEIPMEELRSWFFMTSGNEVPLRVAESWSQVRLNTDHRLVKCITEAIGDNKIDVANLDPLVTLHGVQENSPGQMDSVIRIFTRMADTQNCAIDLSHHTRKLAPGSGADDYTVDDMRGARSISDAMRAVRLLNFMSPQDAENAGLMEIERTTYFRIDRAKANYSAPSKAATWRRFVNVDLPNTDAVGVVVPWQFPGQDGAAPSPEKLEAERKAEHVFLETLRRLNLAGRFVGERGTYNAPAVFKKEREAKMAKVGKAALHDAMRRLFDKGKIRLEEYTKPDRHTGCSIVET
jgi:RecA-family ATPase